MSFDNEMFVNLSPGKVNLNINCAIGEWQYIRDVEARRLYLYGSIASIEESPFGGGSTDEIIENILNYNRIDRDIPPSERTPIKLYINSPGGEVNEGFALISAIELSKTPIYTINIGQWSSMAFLIGIAGHKRFAMPYSMFLMHDGSQIALGSSNKVQDQMEFTKRFEQTVVKKHILKYGKMKAAEYDKLARVEVYMLPKDALKFGFIDEIVTDIEDIL